MTVGSGPTGGILNPLYEGTLGGPGPLTLIATSGTTTVAGTLTVAGTNGIIAPSLVPGTNTTTMVINGNLTIGNKTAAFNCNINGPANDIIDVSGGGLRAVAHRKQGNP